MEPAVRQFEQQRRFDLCVVVDAFTDIELLDEDVETAISLAATIVSSIASSPSNRVALGVAGATYDALRGSSTDLSKRRMLELLADVQPCRQPQLGEAIRKTLSLAQSARDLIVISTRTEDQAIGQDRFEDGRPLSWHGIISPQCKVHWIDVRQENLANWVAEAPA
jgi:uncharacterized protein (DUF58 family)